MKLGADSPLSWLSPRLAIIAGALLLAFAGCADSIHLDPSATTTHGGGTGGEDASVACISNSDCAALKPVCDAPKGVCVQCLVYSDCAVFEEEGVSLVCSKGACVDKSTAYDPTTTTGTGSGGAGGGTGGQGGDVDASSSTGEGGAGGIIDPTGPTGTGGAIAEPEFPER